MTRVFDENEQIKICKQFRASAAKFDRYSKGAFLMLSVFLVAASLFIAGRLDDGKAEASLSSSSSSSGSNNLWWHWVAHAICFGAMVRGSLQFLKFNAERDWREWTQPKTKMFLRRLASAAVTSVILIVQLFVALQKRGAGGAGAVIVFEQIFYECSIAFLAVVHGIAWPFMASWMATTQSELDLLERKKYNITPA